MHNQRFLLNIYHIFIDGLFDSVPILLSFMVLSFNTGEKDAGIIISIAIMVSTFFGLSTKLFSRKLGFSHTLSIIMLFYGIGFSLNAFSKSIYHTGFYFIIAIAGYSLFHNIAFSSITANSERHSLGKAMGNFTAIGDIGRIPFASLAGFIAAYSLFGFSGWRFVCLAYGLGALVLAAYTFISSLGVKENINRKSLPSPTAKKFFPSFSLLSNFHYALPIGANILDGLGSDHIFTFLPFLLIAKGIDPKVIGTFALAFTFGCFLGKVVCGRMVDIFGPRKIFVISEITMAVLLVILIQAQQLSIIIGASLMLGIVTKGTVPVIQTIITQPVKEMHRFDDIFAISTFSRGITGMVTPLLFGFIVSIFNIYWIYSIMAVAAVCAVLPVAMMDRNTSSVNAA